MASRNETTTSGEATAEPGPSKRAAAKKPAAAKRAAAAKPAAAKPAGTKPAAAKPAGTKPAGTSTPRRRTAKVRGIEAIRRHLRDLDAGLFFVGAIPFHLLGLERWVPSLRYVTYYDPWDGANPRVLTPERTGYEPGSPAELTNHLLQHPQVQAHLAEGGRPVKIIAVAYDAETERLCAERGYDLLMPDLAMRGRLESAPRQSIEAGDSWPGDSWPVDSWPVDPVAARPRLVTVSGVSGTPGTIVGPISGVVGHRVELSPIADDWCGSDVLPGTVHPKSRAAVTALVRVEGDRLAEQGYHGYFEVDLLVDGETDAVAVCDLRLRIGGVASTTNLVAGARADLPLLAFHLLEQLGVGYDLDVADLNRRWVDLAAVDSWSQLIIKACDPQPAEIVAAPPTGRWSTGRWSIGAQAAGSPATVPALDGPGLDGPGLDGPAFDALDLVDDDEFYFLRIDGPGEVTWPGADLGIVLTRGRLRVGTGELTPRAQLIVDALRWRYVVVPLGELVVPTIAV